MRVLTKDESQALIQLVFLEKHGFKFNGKDEIPFVCQIIKKRIEALSLPIQFNDAALLSAYCFAPSAGRAVLMLIDCLNKFEGKTVTVEDICQHVYPFGIYTDEEFDDIVDNQLKTKKMKWSEIY